MNNVIWFNNQVVFDFNINCFYLVVCKCIIVWIVNYVLVIYREELKNYKYVVK